MLARIGVRHEGRTDEAYLGLVGKEGSSAFAGSRSRFDESDEAGKGRGEQAHRDEQHHVAVVFPDAHGDENTLGCKTFPACSTWIAPRRRRSGWERAQWWRSWSAEALAPGGVSGLGKP